MRLSVLDLSPIPSGASAGDALRNTVDLARHAESLGYTRYWLAEHHNAGMLACSAPEIMIGQVGAATRTMRIGAGGIMLPNHAALKVAELFRVLEALFPGRVDLGLGRAAGTDPRTAAALRRGASASADEFPAQVEELQRYLRDEGPPRTPFAGGVRAIPLAVPPPDLWVLGSSDYGAAFAAAHGLGFAFAHHIHPALAVEAMRAYRAAFRPSPTKAKPESILALGVVCAATDNEAGDLAACTALGTLRFVRGQRDLPMPSVEEARAHVWSDEDRALLGANDGRLRVGTVDAVRGFVREIAHAAQADEVMIMTSVHDHQARKHSYTLLADALQG